MKKTRLNFIINLGLMISGLIVIFSGLLIQIYYHMGDFRLSELVLGLNHKIWLLIHIISSIVFTLLMVHHVTVLWKWYKGVIKKKLYSKNKQVLILLGIWILVTLTGFIPCISNYYFDQNIFTFLLIEIHDKIGLLFCVYFGIHLIQRLDWYKKYIRS